MTRPGMPYDPESDATQPERSPPPGSDATEVERPPSYPADSDATRRERPLSNHPGSDATQVDRPRSNPPGSDATQFGYPPSYPVSSPPPIYPPGTPGYGAPPYAGQPGHYPAPPPAYPPGGYSPPPQPPSQRRTGLIFAVAGALIVALVVVAAAVLIPMRNRRDSDNALSTQQAQSVAASVTVTTTAASAAPATIPATSTAVATTTVTPTASVAPALSGPTGAWTDAENRVTVRFPADWQKDTFDTRAEDRPLDTAQALLQLTGPDGVRFSVTIYSSAATLDDDVRAFRDAGARDPKIAFKSDQTEDVTVGGEAAKRVTGTYMQNGEPVTIAVWFVDHGGKRFGFSADRVGTHRGEIDAIIASISFVPAGARMATPSAPTNATVPATRASTALATTASIFGTPATPRSPTATRSP